MPIKDLFLSETLSTLRAGVSVLFSVNSHVDSKISMLSKTLQTLATFTCTLFCHSD